MSAEVVDYQGGARRPPLQFEIYTQTGFPNAGGHEAISNGKGQMAKFKWF
jgi:hypothetical protein